VHACSSLQCLVRGSRLNLRAKVGSSRLLEVTREDGLEEGAEDELGTTSLGKRKPEGEDQLKRIVEWEPVNYGNQALQYSEKSEHDPVSEPLSIIGLASREESFERIITGDDETGKVGEDLPSEVEEDEEKVDADYTKNGVNFRDGGLFLEVIENFVLRQFLINLREVVLSAILERHLEA